MKYNPFCQLLNDKHDPNSLEDINDLREISNILQNCEQYDTKSFNKLSKQSFNVSNNKNFSLLFNNIDGCATNFDTFASDIVSQHKHLFSVIGIAETNIEKCHKDLYKLNDYSSIYNDKYPGKIKGSGVGLYVHKDYIYKKATEFTRCTINMEALFITITNIAEAITIGIIYRPHKGSVKDFLTEWEGLLENLPKTNVYIMGDTNIDLLKSNQEFETIFYSHNFVPTISEATHEKPNCTPSLIDNIFINSTENLLNSGILDHKISHHSPIFCFMNYSLLQTAEDVKCPKYDYSASKIDDFIRKINEKTSYNIKYFDTKNFEKFIDYLKNEIELSFRVDEKEFKKSKRNVYVNPWITPGIINSINKKHTFYKLWKKSQTKNNSEGNKDFYIKFKSYRKYLKKLIKLAKKDFYCKKFDSVKGDLKKTWKIINELRGKTKHNIKKHHLLLMGRWLKTDGLFLMDSTTFCISGKESKY